MPRNPDLDENSAGTSIATSNTTGNGVAPQATSVVGAPEPPPQVIETTGGTGAVTVLNPFGPVNRLSEGGITFAYPDLIYSQFIDTDSQIEVTDDTSPGTLILQIPYDPTSQWVNEYIRSYARMHNRYNGDIIYRAQIIGNATFSGTFCWFWWPTEYPNKIVRMADAHKYAYKTQSIQLNSVEELILKDARQYLYYRDINEQDVRFRPHLCLMVHTSVISPLRQGIKVRIRIGSRLAANTPPDLAKMCIPFQFADPVPIANVPTPGADQLNGRSLATVFPHIRTKPFHLTMDGTTTFQYNLLDSLGYGVDFTLNMPVPCLTGGVFPDANSRRLVATNFEVNWVSADKLRVVTIVHQFSPELESKIANDTNFIDICKGDDWLTKVSTMAPLKNALKIHVIRENAARLEVYKHDNFEIILVKQLAIMSEFGKIYVFAYENVVPSNSLTYAAMGGIPNVAGGKRAVLPHSDVLGNVTYTNELISLPSTWVSLKLNLEEPTVVTDNENIAPTLFTDIPIITYFQDLSKNVIQDQVLQFDLVDSESQTRVCSLRYLPTRKEFVINPMDTVKYRQFAGEARNLIIANYGVVPTASSFPLTDTSNWLTRFPKTLLTTMAYFNRHANDFSQSNSMIAGAIEGLVPILEDTTEVLSGTLPKIARMIPKSGPSEEVLTPTNPIITQKPRMNVNIPLLQKVQRPTWTSAWEGEEAYTQPRFRPFKQLSRQESSESTHTYDTVKSQASGSSGVTYSDDFDSLRDYDSVRSQASGSSGVTYSDDFDSSHDYDSIKNDSESGTEPNQDKIDLAQFFGDMSKHLKTLRAMSLGEILHLASNPFEYAKSNGSVVGSMVGSGLNWAHDADLLSKQQGFSSKQQQEYEGWQSQMQGNMFKNQNYMQQQDLANRLAMQQGTFQHQDTMQERSFAQQSRMQKSEQNFEQGMQSNLFGQQTKLNNMDFQHNLQLGKQQILGGLATTALGGVSSVVGGVVSKGFDVYMQNKQQDFIKQQSVTNFNNQIQAAGAGAPALKLAA